MKKLTRVEYRWQADAILANMQSRQIDAHFQFLPREYSAILTGQGDGNFDIYVEDAQFENALELLSKLDSKLDDKQIEFIDGISPLADDFNRLEKTIPENTFKKLMLFSLMGIIFLPVLFNFAAIPQFKLFIKSHASKSKKAIGTIWFFLCWVISFVEVFWFLHNY